MLRLLASWFNYSGNKAADRGRRDLALKHYQRAARCDPGWSVPYFNLGLHTKHLCQWEDSLRFNRRATELDDQDEGAWWNLGIAATALQDWTIARRAWRRLNIDVPDDGGEWTGPAVTACVRLNPERDGEVVWGERLDPARLIVLNVPLPESKHRFKDIVLNDGAANGRRVLDGEEVPVFDELQIWRASAYSTYEVIFRAEDPALDSKLSEIGNDLGCGIEDWSTIRWLCAECSRGNPGPHECKAEDRDPSLRRIAIAATTEEAVQQAIGIVMQRSPEAQFLGLELLLPAATPLPTDLP